MHVLEKEISDSSDSDDSETSYSSSDLDDREYDPWTDPWTSYSLNSYYDEIYDNNGRSYKYRLYCFLAECPDPEIQQRLENYYFNHPIATALYLKEWLNDFYKRSDESQQTLILQKMRETMQAADMTRDVLVAAKFLLTHNQDHEPAIHALWKLVKEQASNDSEESEKEGEEEGEKDYEDYEKTNRLIMACKTLLKYAPTSPVRESVLSRLFTEAEQELFPRALVLLLTQEDPSISTRARELAEQRLDQNSLEYTLDLFFNLEEKNLEQDLRHKIQEKLKTKFNDSKDKAILLRLAPVFLRATDENLSQKAFNYLRQDLINNNYPAYVKTIVYQIIKAVGVDHPWAQEVINIGMEIGIEPSLSLREIKAPSVMTGEPSSSFSMAAPSSINLPSEDSVSGGS
ncbi:hypothetical protein QPK87_23485 [Kamptonema cortianum]|nr:hypothetical protein [Kamptonema cortianum]